jgi:hypothetical protein
LERRPSLSRALVSYQRNKSLPGFRWFKYKEGFSSEFVRLCLDYFSAGNGAGKKVLDPFAGVGTTLLTSAKEGWHGTGIELLPVAAEVARTRNLALGVSIADFQTELDRLSGCQSRNGKPGSYKFPHVRITEHAFPEETERELGRYVDFVNGIKKADIRQLFKFAALASLEDVSYTRKDGQYLRWDRRSMKNPDSTFEKPIISDFRDAVWSKLQLIREDLLLFSQKKPSGDVTIIEGSTLLQLPELTRSTFDLVITSPPYCNRYDYTRTYALELAFLGYTDSDISRLRQGLLSATVENKSKQSELGESYTRMGLGEMYAEAERTFSSNAALHEALQILLAARDRKELNNPNIPSMISNYFFEMSLTIYCLARVLRRDGLVFMVNDNVQYQGEHIPVDLILSEFAKSAGFSIEAIWVLPKGKGNSSQQMGLHGRNELRKCVYVWRRR